MRNQVQDALVAFRANSAVVAALSESARASGCSVSEYLRAIIIEKVGMQ